MSGLLVNLYSSIDKAAVQEKKLHYILEDSILLSDLTGRYYKHSVCYLIWKMLQLTVCMLSHKHARERVYIKEDYC